MLALGAAGVMLLGDAAAQPRSSPTHAIVRGVAAALAGALLAERRRVPFVGAPMRCVMARARVESRRVALPSGHGEASWSSRASCSWRCVGGCQPLYGGKPEKLPQPEPTKPPPEAEPEAVVEIKYVDDCHADFRDDPKDVKQHEPAVANAAHRATATTAHATRGDKAKDDQAQAEPDQEAIDKYRNALLKDPYNAEATLKLAIAYDKVYRKGCAIAMLQAPRRARRRTRSGGRTANARDRRGRRRTRQWFKALPQGRDGGGRDDERVSLRCAAVVRACSACHGKTKVTAPPPPLRPEPERRPRRSQATVRREGLRADRRRRTSQAAHVRRALDPRGHDASPTRARRQLRDARERRGRRARRART